jgi:ubiquinone/menaquinone biosynthesis C-methylase UbiE
MSADLNFYDDFYRKKDFRHFKQDRVYIQLLCTYLLNPSESIVLDVGCGKGYWSKLFRECGIGHIIGSDISRTAINIARQFDSVDFMLSDANHCNFRDETFDLVFCQGLPLFNIDDLLILKILGFEFLRCLKNNGIFVFAWATNLSGKRNKNSWINHKQESIQNYLVNLGYQIEATYLIDRLFFLRIFGRNVDKNIFTKYILPAICRLTKLPVYVVFIVRKKLVT